MRCECGHTETEHRAGGDDRRCFRCPCQTYTAARLVVPVSGGAA